MIKVFRLKNLAYIVDDLHFKDDHISKILIKDDSSSLFSIISSILQYNGDIIGRDY